VAPGAGPRRCRRPAITLLAGIGRGIEVNAMDSALVESAIGWLSAREAA
jgi:3-dehydroquinate synthase